VALVAFLVTTPFFLSLRDHYTTDLAYTLACERGGQIGRVQLGALDYLVSRTPTWETPWLGTSLRSDLGLPALLLAAGGLGLAATGWLGFAGAVYAVTAIVYVASISGAGWIKAIRFLLPAMPFLYALAGAAAERLVPPPRRAIRRPQLLLRRRVRGRSGEHTLLPPLGGALRGLPRPARRGGRRRARGDRLGHRPAGARHPHLAAPRPGGGERPRHERRPIEPTVVIRGLRRCMAMRYP